MFGGLFFMYFSIECLSEFDFGFRFKIIGLCSLETLSA